MSLTYAWTLSSRPAGSTAALTKVDTASPILTTDRDGTCTTPLVANDGPHGSAPDSVTVTPHRDFPNPRRVNWREETSMTPNTETATLQPNGMIPVKRVLVILRWRGHNRW